METYRRWALRSDTTRLRSVFSALPTSTSFPVPTTGSVKREAHHPKKAAHSDSPHGADPKLHGWGLIDWMSSGVHQNRRGPLNDRYSPMRVPPACSIADNAAPQESHLPAILISIAKRRSRRRDRRRATKVTGMDTPAAIKSTGIIKQPRIADNGKGIVSRPMRAVFTLLKE